MSNAKEKATTLLNTLPDQASWDDILYVLYVKKQIEQGLQGSDDGNTLSHEDAIEWLRKEIGY